MRRTTRKLVRVLNKQPAREPGGGLFLPRRDLLFYSKVFSPVTGKIEDTVGANERTLYSLQYIQCDGTGYFTNASLTSAATISKQGTSTCSFTTAGRMTCTSGTLWSFTITYADAYVGKYEFCTQTGTTSGVCYDLNAGHRNLVATGFATIANIFGIGYSYGSDWLNQYGWTSATYAPVPSSAYDPTKDALGNTLQYPGRAKNSLTPVQSPCATMASGTSIAITPGAGGVAIVSGSTYVNAGTATITVGTNSITYLAAGSLYNLRITSKGRTITFPMSEGSGTTVYGYDNTGANYIGTITSSDINAFWAQKQDVYHHNLQYGYTNKVSVSGGIFTFDASSASSCKLRIDTNGNVPWFLDGNLVQSGQWIVVNKDTGKVFNFGVFDVNINSIYFYNQDYSQYRIIFSLSDLSAMRPTGTLQLYNLPLVTGALSDLSAMRPTWSLMLYNIPLVTGSLSDLSAMRPAGSLLLYNMPLVTGDIRSLKDVPGTGTVQINLLGVTLCSVTSGFMVGRKSFNLSGCGFTQQAVDNVLLCCDSAGLSGGTLNLTGGTSSAPSASGLVTKASLVAKGWTVTHN